MKWMTYIPTTRNDDSQVDPAELNDIIRKAYMTFNGASVDRITEGHWIDSRDNQYYRDFSLKLTVVCEPERLPEAEQFVRQIGKQLGQKEMYFEVQYFDGVRFLRTDE